MYARATSYSTRSRAATARAPSLRPRRPVSRPIARAHARGRAFKRRDSKTAAAIRDARCARCRSSRALARASFARLPRVRPRATRAKLFLRPDRRPSRRARARDDVRAATRLPRAPRRGLDECGARAARRADAGADVFVSGRGFVTYITRPNAHVRRHENEHDRAGHLAVRAVARSVARARSLAPQSRAGVRRCASRARGRPSCRRRGRT